VDGSITNHTWIFGDRTFAFTAVTDHTYSVNGSYNVTLVVVDDDGAIAYATVRIIVGNTAPFAVARANTAYALTYEDVEFNASSSSDVDDNIASYAWDFGDGFSATDKVVVHNFTDDGIYDVTLTVTDTGGVFGISTVSIVIENRAPVAIFEDLVVTTHEPAWFNGSMCWDMDGYIASYLWDLGDGLIYTTANASHTWDGPGKFLIKLKIWDDDGATNVTEFNVTVLNQSPIASMTASPLKTTLAHPVVFNGSTSRDPDGTIVNWTWSFGDGARGYGELVNHTYTAYGTYLASLAVRDDSGGINSTTVTITVRNQPPLTVMNVTPLIAFTGEVITFDGRNSSDPENQIAEYFWSFGDGTSATGPLVTHTYADDSWYTVRLTVADQDATTSFMEVVVKITNRAPTAKAEASPTSAKTLVDMAFKGTLSYDEDGRVLWYRWDFGDGTVGYGENVVHVFADDGIYTVTLTVTDDDGTEGTDTVEVTVINRAPTSVAGNDQSTRTGIPIRLDGRQSYDLDGTIAEYHWDFGDETTATGPVVTHAFPSYGSFMVVLTVTDDDGATSVSNLTVDVDNVQPVARFTGNTRILSGDVLELDGTSSYDLDGTIAEQDDPRSRWVGFRRLRW
jgi:PKD repeat protein